MEAQSRQDPVLEAVNLLLGDPFAPEFTDRSEALALIVGNLCLGWEERSTKGPGEWDIRVYDFIDHHCGWTMS